MIKIRALVLDFGNVITLPQDQARVDEMAAVLGAENRLEEFVAAYFASRPPYDAGALDCRGYWAAVAAALGSSIRIDPATARGLARLDMASWFCVDPEMLSFIEEVRPAVAKLLLLSNAPHEAAELIRSSSPWIQAFDASIFSCEAGANKPDPAIYRACVRAAGVGAEECLLVDDHGPNVAGARAFGMRAIHYRGMPALRSELSAYSFSR